MKIDERKIFLLDGAGALFSASSSGLLLPLFHRWTGVQTSVTLPLALIGLTFAIYSLICFLFVNRTRPAMLLAIILANLSYCVLSIILAFTLTGITFWGRTYFFVEALIVFGVVFVEVLVYRRTFTSRR